MQIIKVKNNKLDKISIQEILKVLKANGVIVYPTDTAYALGGIFDSKKVINRILKIKKRKDKKFTIVVCSLNQVQKFFKLNPAQRKLAKKYWPGPLSIVVSKNFAVRVPRNEITQTLARRINKPLIATSANISGQKSTYDVKEILKQFRNKKNSRLPSGLSRQAIGGQVPDLLLDDGKLKKVKPSTVVEVKNKKIKVLRKGAVEIND